MITTIKYIGKCGDCIYARPTKIDWGKNILKCNWNHRCHSPNHECEIHSFFPRKRKAEDDNEIQEWR